VALLHHLKLNDDLLGRDTGLVLVAALLHVLEALANDKGLRDALQLTLLQGLRDIALPHGVSGLTDAEDVADLDSLGHLLGAGESDRKVAGTSLLHDGHGDLVAVCVGDGVVHTDEVTWLRGLDGLGDVVYHGRVLVVESLAGTERFAEVVVLLGGDGDHVDSGCHGELDDKGTDGGAGAVDNKGLAALGGSESGILEAHEALVTSTVETSGSSVECERENGRLAVASAVGNLCGDGCRAGSVELEATVPGVLGAQTDGVAHDTIALLEVLHAAADFDDLAGDVAAEDNGPVLDENAIVLDLPIDWVDGNRVVLDDNLSVIGLRNFGAGDTEFNALSVKVRCLVRHCDCSGLVDEYRCGLLQCWSLIADCS
jgi:hypothetical protein